MGKRLIERWVGNKRALENPLFFLAHSLFEVCRVWFITSLGSWEIWQRQCCPLTLGETGSNKGNKSLPRRPFWPQSSSDAQAAGAGFLFLLYVECPAAITVLFNLIIQNGEKYRDAPVMPERGPKLLMALSSQRKQSFGETVSRKTMCRSGTIARSVHIWGLYFCNLFFFR